MLINTQLTHFENGELQGISNYAHFFISVHFTMRSLNFLQRELQHLNPFRRCRIVSRDFDLNSGDL